MKQLLNFVTALLFSSFKNVQLMMPVLVREQWQGTSAMKEATDFLEIMKEYVRVMELGQAGDLIVPVSLSSVYL